MPLPTEQSISTAVRTTASAKTAPAAASTSAPAAASTASDGVRNGEMQSLIITLDQPDAGLADRTQQTNVSTIERNTAPATAASRHALDDDQIAALFGDTTGATEGLVMGATATTVAAGGNAAPSAAASGANAATTAAASDTKKSRGVKTANFTREEDQLLCKAYVHCTADNKVGTGQKEHVFWKKVLVYFDTLVKAEQVICPSKRIWQSLQSRFNKTIAPRTKDLVAIHRNVLGENPSGYTDSDKFKLALDRYRTKKGSEYKFTECLQFLKTLPKFDPTQKVLKLTANPVTNPLTSPMGSTMEKPIGRNKAKQVASEVDSLKGMIAKQNALIERQMELYEKQSSSMRAAVATKSTKDGLHRSTLLQHQTLMATANFEISCGNNDLARELFIQANQLAAELRESALKEVEDIEQEQLPQGCQH